MFHMSAWSAGGWVPASSGGGASSRLKLGDYQVKSCFLGDQLSKVENMLTRNMSYVADPLWEV